MCLNGIRMAGWLADCLTGGSDGCLFASPLAGWLAKVSDGWPAACMTACHPMSPSSRRRHACLPPSPSYAAPLGQANYPLARIPICFPHSHQCYKEKAKVSSHYRPTPPPQGKRAMPLLEFFHAFCILAYCKNIIFVPSPSYTPRQASYPLANEKAKVSCHSRPTHPLGQASYNLSRIPICSSHSHR